MTSRDEARISWSNQELSFIGFFESATGTRAIDCVMANNDKTVFFLLKPEDAERIKHGYRILLQHFSKRIGKEVQILEYHEDVETFLKRALHPVKVLEIRLENGVKGGKVAYLTVDDAEKGRAIGRNGFRIQGIREIARRHFNLSDVKIR
ncbi:MAG: NusA-like transcription termination signal-binding factor [Thaumarchaeota archaeon]|jgi:N utilization substance protein A|nr:NusA-like transcription termination signal-binding factor [Nitrososphaerota archaeon]